MATPVSCYMLFVSGHTSRTWCGLSVQAENGSVRVRVHKCGRFRYHARTRRLPAGVSGSSPPFSRHSASARTYSLYSASTSSAGDFAICEDWRLESHQRRGPHEMHVSTGVTDGQGANGERLVLCLA